MIWALVRAGDSNVDQPQGQVSLIFGLFGGPQTEMIA